MSPDEKQKRLDFALSKIDSIPSLPSVVLELIRLIDNPMSSTGQIEELLSKDQGLTLKALRLANSAYYAIPGGATTLKRAITYLGLNTVKQLVVSASVFDAFKKLDSPKFSLKEFWKHSMGTAIVAESLAKHLKGSSEEVFICGLIHDLGKLALLMVDKEDLFKTVDFAHENGMTFYQAELERTAPFHTFWGSQLAKKWQLPPLLQAVIKDHHSANPGARGVVTPETNKIIDLIFISNQLVHHLGYGDSGYFVKPELNNDVLVRLNLKWGENENWYLKAKKTLNHADSLVQELLV